MAHGAPLPNDSRLKHPTTQAQLPAEAEVVVDEQRHEGATSGPLVAVADPGRADGQPAFDARLGLLTLVMRWSRPARC